MPVADFKVLSHDKTEQRLNADNPLAVQTVSEGGVAAEDLLYATGTVAVAGPTALVAAPGGGIRIVVSWFVIQNESAVATTMILAEGGTNVLRNLAQNQGNGLSGTFPVGREWKLPANAALNFLLSGANSCGYTIAYYTEAV